jgi:D-inositol-3-phosphate glycosyltransferase
MISFVWSSTYPFWAGTGGSENYTAGHIRELQRRGIPTRILTLGFGTNDGREDFPDIEFKALRSINELSHLNDTLVFVTYPLDVPTRRPSYTILHCQPLTRGRNDPRLSASAMKGKQLIAPSKFAAKLWGRHLRQPLGRIPAVYPFAEPVFSQVKRPKNRDTSKTKILFAGRLTPDKGIFTLLAALHMSGMQDVDYELTVTTAGKHTPEGSVIHAMLQAHPLVTVVPARRTPREMAELMAEQDIVLMPSSNIFWKEVFGIVSVEAQHAGCRVVASNAGGLPETDCGGLVLVKPDDPQSLANGIVKAAYHGPLTTAERLFASTKFTVESSADSLLKVIETTDRKYENRLHFQKQGALVRQQLDTAVKGIVQLGLGIAGNDELSYRRAR